MQGDIKEDETMSLRKANITWNCNQLTKMIKGAKISFDNVVQRSFVWDKKRKSDLIESLIIGYPILQSMLREVNKKFMIFWMVNRD